jgi:hypothetical protein
MISAAPVMTPAVLARPSATDAVLSRVPAIAIFAASPKR